LTSRSNFFPRISKILFHATVLSNLTVLFSRQKYRLGIYVGQPEVCQQFRSRAQDPPLQIEKSCRNAI
jgi:hypothetical protein